MMIAFEKLETDTANTNDWLGAFERLETDTANTKDRLEMNEGIKIVVYHDLEFQAWDIFSDEALANFERGLGSEEVNP